MTKICLPLEQLVSSMPYEQIDDLLAHGIAEKVDDTPRIPRLLFLDVDGVLNNSRHRNPYKGCMDEKLFLGSFDPKCLGFLLNVLDDVPDTKIVISSTWRKDPLLMKVLHTKLGRYSRNVIGSTESFNHGFRGLEIEHFLYTYFRDQEITMCILDDDGDFFPHQKQFHIQTDPEYGVTKTIAYRVLQRLLNSKRTIS
ncbi:hypothetical protein EVB55_184 [Rhizobium phage RHph_Y68]|uniref:Uncharacterized protein n=1 Tax=Rhizobium phage RHph_Y68 TaxID=2509787 RepID=A0A7S5R9A7_9CAUD|nr:hypothetical protein PP934_gp184 [Rhizobium phage RHph_Y68]QIG68119.1 hypothetical protein EVB55_184 [Rhizobium phage RHph_Y68]